MSQNNYLFYNTDLSIAYRLISKFFCVEMSMNATKNCEFSIDIAKLQKKLHKTYLVKSSLCTDKKIISPLRSWALKHVTMHKIDYLQIANNTYL